MIPFTASPTIQPIKKQSITVPEHSEVVHLIAARRCFTSCSCVSNFLKPSANIYAQMSVLQLLTPVFLLEKTVGIIVCYRIN